jgi:hypothetical protein
MLMRMSVHPPNTTTTPPGTQQLSGYVVMTRLSVCGCSCWQPVRCWQGSCCYSPAYTQGPAFHCRRFISIRAVRSRHPHISPSCRVFVDTTCSSVPAGTARSDAHTIQQVSSRTPSEHGCDGKGEIRYSSNPVACRAFGHSMHTWPILCAANVQPAAVCYQQALNMSLVCHLNHLLCPHVGTIILPGEGHSANP